MVQFVGCLGLGAYSFLWSHDLLSEIVMEESKWGLKSTQVLFPVIAQNDNQNKTEYPPLMCFCRCCELSFASGSNANSGCMGNSAFTGPSSSLKRQHLSCGLELRSCHPPHDARDCTENFVADSSTCGGRDPRRLYSGLKGRLFSSQFCCGPYKCTKVWKKVTRGILRPNYI